MPMNSVGNKHNLWQGYNSTSASKVHRLESNLLAQEVSMPSHIQEMRVVILARLLSEHQPYVQSRAEDRNERDLTFRINNPARDKKHSPINCNIK